jgi:hypothetical protein
MLSHFVADACMPCHCDKRDLNDYDNGLHKEWEAAFAKMLGNSFDKKNILDPKNAGISLTDEARKAGLRNQMQFPDAIEDIKNYDLWEETVVQARASFALMNILMPESKIPFGSKTLTTYEEVFTDPVLENTINRMMLQDAVYNIAQVWKEIWKKLEK